MNANDIQVPMSGWVLQIQSGNLLQLQSSMSDEASQRPFLNIRICKQEICCQRIDIVRTG